MKEALFFYIKKHIKSTKLSLIGASILYQVFVLIFLIKKSFLRRKKHRKFTEEEARCYLKSKMPFWDNVYKGNNQIGNPEIECSVIMPVYNHEDIIEKTIDAVMNQECTFNYEVILIDDGSSQATKEILKKYEVFEKCHVIYQENQGIGCARNTGLDCAVGKYIMFVDCDDIVKNNILQTLLEKAIECDSDIVMGGYQLIKESGNQIIDVKDYIYPERLIVNNTEENNIMSLPGYPWGKIYRRELFDNVRFLPGYWYEDTIVQFILYRRCKTYTYVPQVLYEYKWHGKNFSNVQGSKANVKAVQRYWMLLLLIKLSDEIGLPQDETFYITLLRHLGSYYYHNVKDFDDDLRQAMFIAGAELLKKYKRKKKYKMSFILKQVEKSLLEHDYELWQLACQYQ